MCLSVSEFEAHDGEFWKMGVRSNELSTPCAVFGDGIVDWVEITVVVLMEDVSMSMRKSSSFDILARKSNVKTVLDKSGES